MLLVDYKGSELQADDFHRGEIGEVLVLGPDLATVGQSRRRDPSVVDPRLTAGLKLSCRQPCVCGSDPVVRRQPRGLFFLRH